MQMHRLISDFLDNDWLISDRQLKFMLFITRNTHFTLGAAHDAWLQIINIELEHCVALPRRNMPSSSGLF